MSFISSFKSLKQEYLDMFDRVKSDGTYIVKYDENSDIRTTYLGMLKMKRQDEIKAEHIIHITENYYMQCKLLECIDGRVLFDTGASKSYMSRHYFCIIHQYILCLSLDQ